MSKLFVTHNSRFHSDDVFACATLLLLFPDARVMRTRDMETISQADIVFDVGGIYDADTGRFDHHQLGGAGARANKIPYAAFGLVWKQFGKDIAGSAEVAERVDKKLVQSIDAMDNGIDLHQATRSPLQPYIFQTITFAFNPTWKENPDTTDARFFEMVDFAKKIIEREVKQATDIHEAEAFITDAYDRAPNKRIIELDRNYPWLEIIAQYPEPLYVVSPSSQSSQWKVEAVRNDVNVYTPRKQLPETWAGRSGEELTRVTGVDDAVFCHNGRFLVVARSREGALTLAQKAVQA